MRLSLFFDSRFEQLADRALVVLLQPNLHRSQRANLSGIGSKLRIDRCLNSRHVSPLWLSRSPAIASVPNRSMSFRDRSLRRVVPLPLLASFLCLRAKGRALAIRTRSSSGEISSDGPSRNASRPHSPPPSFPPDKLRKNSLYACSMSKSI